MAQLIFPPKHPLNPAIKSEMLKTLRRTDVYVIENNDEDNLFYSTKINNMRDETLIQYDYDQDQGTHTIAYMGVVVAEMEMHISMNLTKQHKDILNVCQRIDNKAEKFKELSDAKDKMSKEESLAYQRAIREAQNARYD